jgi:hypothetical protein
MLHVGARSTTHTFIKPAGDAGSSAALGAQTMACIVTYSSAVLVDASFMVCRSEPAQHPSGVQRHSMLPLHLTLQAFLEQPAVMPQTWKVLASALVVRNNQTELRRMQADLC